jgi:hypothetical protein
VSEAAPFALARVEVASLELGSLELAWLFAHFISTLLMVGLIWFVQIVHYPLMADIAPECFPHYERQHQSRTTYVVAIPMLVELATGLALLAYDDLRTSWQFLLAEVLLGAIWISTWRVQVPLHDALSACHDAECIRRLVRTNWLRTMAWTLRAVLIGGLLWSRIPPST